jgi:hypothetical protein
MNPPEHFSLERLREVEVFARERGLSTFVYCGWFYVLDGGETARRERGEWWGSFGHSSRKATEADIEFCRGLESLL